MSLRAVAAFAILLAIQPARSSVQNGGFEEGDVGSIPAGWVVPSAVTAAGYRAAVSDESPKTGTRAALLARDPNATTTTGFGNLMQRIDAVPFRNRRVTLRASVRTSPGSRAQLWLRVDRPDGQLGFLDNMSDRPILTSAWGEYQIQANVHPDAVSIVIGCMLFGEKAWLDDVSIDSVALTVRPSAPPRAFDARGLDNVVAFTRLLGYVRYFHPSDEAARADWDQFAIEGVDAVEGAPTSAALARLLEERFRTVAPTVRVYSGQAPELPTDLRPSPAVRRVTMWKHRGVGIKPGGIYSSQRLMLESAGGALPAGVANPAEPLVIDLGGGVKAAVPIALWTDDKGTLPHGPVPPPPPATVTYASDRATRLAAVALAWNVFQHFYPYFDVVQADWPASLRRALTSAAEDADEGAFADTLRRLVADLHDGHGSVRGGPSPVASLPLAWDWIEGRLVVTEVRPGETGVQRGDAIVAIDGTPAATALAARERVVSGATPQWIRYRALGELQRGPPGDVKLSVATRDGVREVHVSRTAAVPVAEHRPDPIAEVRPGIFYVDPERLSDQAFTAALPRLVNARGIVFEMRGYPALSPIFIRHLIDRPVQSAQWLVPTVTRPDREAITFDGAGRWNLLPIAPRLTATIAFVTDGRAISYAESCMGIIEYYKLGEIVGGPTAGTNGNVNPFTLPGGFTVSWTGMKVLKHDGSRHHGVGIQPTIPVSRTIAGVREGRDELLERAIAAVQK